MSPNERERWLLNALALLCAMLILYEVIFRDYFGSRAELADQRDAGIRAVELARYTIREEKNLRHFLAGDGATMTAPPSVVEGRVLHLVHDWETQAGVTHLAFQRTAAVPQHGFTVLTFGITADGSLASIAGLLYRAETSPLPLRIESFSLHPKTGGDDLQMNLALSALSRGEPPKAAPPSSAEPDLSDTLLSAGGHP
jgi:hypothetical protein